MNLFIKSIFTTGIQPKLNFHKKRDIIFLNQVSFALIITSGLICVANLTLGFYSRSLVSLTMIPLLVSVFFFQKQHKYFTAKVLTIFTIIGGTFLSTLLFGNTAKTQFYLFATIALSMVLFHHRFQHIVLFVIHVICFAFLGIYFKENTSIILGQDSELLAYFHVPLIFVSVYVILSEYVLHYKRYQNRMIELMSTLKEHGELLEIEKTKFEVQTEILKMTNDQLTSEIAHKESIQKELIESNTSLEQFAYVASHDLKEPLRTIGSFSQLLKKKLEGKLDQETGEYFQYVIQGVQRMSSLLDDLLAFSRLNKTEELMKVNLNDCLELNVLNLRNSIEQNKGKVVFSEMPTIIANRPQINQLFQNLISNGLKFKRDENPEVSINCEEKEDCYLFTVKDNGIGIDEKYHEKVFVIFQRMNEKAKYEGSGIGLAICKKIVQNHRGKIWLESKVGEGSTFFFTIAKYKKEPIPIEKEEGKK